VKIEISVIRWWWRWWWVENKREEKERDGLIWGRRGDRETLF
jgi:hypothetical protein